MPWQDRIPIPLPGMSMAHIVLVSGMVVVAIGDLCLFLSGLLE